MRFTLFPLGVALLQIAAFLLFKEPFMEPDQRFVPYMMGSMITGAIMIIAFGLRLRMLAVVAYAQIAIPIGVHAWTIGYVGICVLTILFNLFIAITAHLAAESGKGRCFDFLICLPFGIGFFAGGLYLLLQKDPQKA